MLNEEKFTVHKELLTACFWALITLLAIIFGGYVFYRNLPPRIATVDLQKLVVEDQQRLLNKITQGGGHATEEQRAAMQVLTVDFAKKVSGAIDTLSQECHCVLVNKSALLAGSPADYTDWVRKKVQQ